MRYILILFLIYCGSYLYGQERSCICNATVVRGDLSAMEIADVVVQGDIIIEIGRLKDTSNCDHIVDASGKIVAPGFIDMHAHGDPLKQYSFQNFIAMGVTTIVLGMDGTGVDYDYSGKNSFSAWKTAVEDSDLELNIIPFLGHNTLLAKYADDSKRSLEILGQGLADGAWGLSMGLEYAPGLFETTKDLIPLANIVKEYNRMIMAHIRSEDDDAIEAAIDEMRVLDEICQTHISHLKVVYGKGSDRANEIIALLNSNEDNPLSADFYPYLASYTGIAILFPKWAKTVQDFNKALKERNEELRQYLKDRIIKRNGPQATLLCTGPHTGKTLDEISNELDTPVVELLLQWGPKYGSGAYFIMDSSLQVNLALDTLIAFGTDGSPTMHHPRGYGSHAKIISEWVLRDSILSLPLAIYKMTKRPAEILDLKDRGELKVGYKADLVLFDPNTIASTADYTSPKSLAEGFEQVWVNGKLVWENHQVQIKSAGKLLLRQ